jgi:hypothetical protein
VSRAARPRPTPTRVGAPAALTRAVRTAGPAAARAILALVSLVALAPHCALAQESTTAPASSAAARGAISVRVLDENGQPVRNASVFTSRAGGQPSRFSYDNSAAAGRYVGGNLDPGLYRVNVGAPGYVTEPAAADPEAPPAYYRPGDSVTFRLIKGGVITGRVTDADGDPVVGARVGALRVRDLSPGAGQSAPPEFARPRERRTDDRGVYRIYGLPAGVYVVFAGGRSLTGGRPTAYDADAPTYYPSAPRDGASEVAVQTGQELTDVDIRHRGERGHTVSGTVTGATAPPARSNFRPFDSVRLAYLDGAFAGQGLVQGEGAARGFLIEGVGDGDYELTAASVVGPEAGAASTPLRFSVRGADVTGLRLTLEPLASLSGRVSLETTPPAATASPTSETSKPACRAGHEPSPEEIVIMAIRDDAPASPQSPSALGAFVENAPGGAFNVTNLRPGRYRLSARLLDDDLYVRSITLPPTANANATDASATATKANAASATAAGAGATQPRPAARPAAAADAARDGFNVRAGERLSGALVTVAKGAAALRGRVVPAAEGEPLPENLRVHLVPAERERAEDLLRYSEASARPDGTFAFRNLAPGRYLLVARTALAPQVAPARPPRPLARDAAARATLRREAESAKNVVELQPCQRAEEFTLRLPER